MKIVVLVTAIILVVATFSYRLLPFRMAGERRPYLVFFPKYKKLISSCASDQSLADKLAQYGFVQNKQSGATINFTRGSVLGDLSIELSKVDVGITRVNEKEIEITVQAGWVAAFDTGDHWRLITRLAEEIQGA